MKPKDRKAKKTGKVNRKRMSWMAMGAVGALVACPGAGNSGLTAALGREIHAAVRASSSAAQAQKTTVTFNIPAQTMGPALDAFEAASGVHIMVANDSIRSLDAPGVTGTLTVDQALRTLLAGSHITFRYTASNTVTLAIEAEDQTVDIHGDLPVTSPKFTEALINTPQSISLVENEVMKEQGTTTLRDALRNVPGISLAAGEAGAQGDNLTVRGFTARNDLFIDGMRDFGSYYRDPFNTERVEVLQGPTSVSFGRGSTGGVVNQATKTPLLAPGISGSALFGSDLTRRITLDINEPIKAFGDGAAFRLNLMGNDGNIAERDVAENRRFGIAPSLALGLGTPTRFIFSYVHQQANDIPDYGLPWLFNAPAPVDRSNYYGFKNGNFLRTKDDIGTARVEHTFNDNVTVQNQIRYANYARDVLITEAQVATPVTPTMPLANSLVNRHEIGVDSVETFLQNQTDLTARFQTGKVGHTLVTGVEVGRETSSPTRPTLTNVPTTSLLSPNFDQVFSGTSVITSRINTVANTAGAYAVDTVKLGQKLSLIGGVRWDRFDATSVQSVAPVSSFSRVDEMVSWRGAVVYKPVPIGSIYFDYGTSFNPSAEALSLTAANANLPPEKNRTFEVGSKWDLARGHLSLRGSVFTTEKTNAREPDPTNSLLNVLAGEQRVNGFELEAGGHITSRWELLAGYAFLDSKVISSKAFPASVGAQLANVPRSTFNIWSSYYLPHQWEIGGGANYVGSRTASSTVPLDPTTHLLKEVPGYLVFRAMVSHRLNEHLELQFNGNNLTNKYYFDLIHPAHVIPGEGRTITGGLNFKF